MALPVLSMIHRRAPGSVSRGRGVSRTPHARGKARRLAGHVDGPRGAKRASCRAHPRPALVLCRRVLGALQWGIRKCGSRLGAGRERVKADACGGVGPSYACAYSAHRCTVGHSAHEEM